MWNDNWIVFKFSVGELAYKYSEYPLMLINNSKLMSDILIIY